MNALVKNVLLAALLVAASGCTDSESLDREFASSQAGDLVGSYEVPGVGIMVFGDDGWYQLAFCWDPTNPRCENHDFDLHAQGRYALSDDGTTLELSETAAFNYQPTSFIYPIGPLQVRPLPDGLQLENVAGDTWDLIRSEAALCVVWDDCHTQGLPADCGGKPCDCADDNTCTRDTVAEAEAECGELGGVCMWSPERCDPDVRISDEMCDCCPEW